MPRQEPKDRTDTGNHLCEGSLRDRNATEARAAAAREVEGKANDAAFKGKTTPSGHYRYLSGTPSRGWAPKD